MRLFLLPLLAVLSIGLAAGCGDDEDDAPETVTETTTVTETVTGPREPEPTVPTEAPQDEGPGDGGTSPPARHSCGQVAYEENTDSGAFDIRSIGVPCDTARAVASAAQGQQTLGFSARGFDCQGERRDTELPSVRWVCLGEQQQQVTFQTS